MIFRATVRLISIFLDCPTKLMKSPQDDFTTIAIFGFNIINYFEKHPPGNHVLKNSLKYCMDHTLRQNFSGRFGAIRPNYNQLWRIYDLKLLKD
jgi:hypothetical protein